MTALTHGTLFRQLEPELPLPAITEAPNSFLPKIISLFAGAGGLDLGFKNAGFEVVFAADNMAAAIETHKHNFPECLSKTLDLASTDPAVVAEMINEVIEPGSLIAVIGGPPCQGFSRSNSASAANDPRNTLIEHYCDIVCKLQETYIVEFVIFENVLGIKDKKHKAVYEAFIQRLTDAGLVTYERIVLASDFGVPQTRKRVVVLGSGKGDLLINMKNSKITKDKLTVRKAFAGFCEPVFFSKDLKPESFALHPNHWTMRPRSERFAVQPFKESGRSFRRLKWDALSPTIAMGHREIPVHPEGKRRISIWEAMKLQGFPSKFELMGTLSDQVVLVSNAVPPPLATTLARTIKRNLIAHARKPRQRS